MILGVDISTSITGFAIVADGSLLYYDSIDLRKFKNFFEKAEVIKNKLTEVKNVRFTNKNNPRTSNPCKRAIKPFRKMTPPITTKPFMNDMNKSFLNEYFFNNQSFIDRILLFNYQFNFIRSKISFWTNKHTAIFFL